MWASMSDRPANDVDCCVTFLAASDAVRVLGWGEGGVVFSHAFWFGRDRRKSFEHQIQCAAKCATYSTV